MAASISPPTAAARTSKTLRAGPSVRCASSGAVKRARNLAALATDGEGVALLRPEAGYTPLESFPLQSGEKVTAPPLALVAGQSQPPSDKAVTVALVARGKAYEARIYTSIFSRGFGQRLDSDDQPFSLSLPSKGVAVTPVDATGKKIAIVLEGGQVLLLDWAARSLQSTDSRAEGTLLDLGALADGALGVLTVRSSSKVVLQKLSTPYTKITSTTLPTKGTIIGASLFRTGQVRVLTSHGLQTIAPNGDVQTVPAKGKAVLSLNESFALTLGADVSLYDTQLGLEIAHQTLPSAGTSLTRLAQDRILVSLQKGKEHLLLQVQVSVPPSSSLRAALSVARPAEAGLSLEGKGADDILAEWPAGGSAPFTLTQGVVSQLAATALEHGGEAGQTLLLRLASVLPQDNIPLRVYQLYGLGFTLRLLRQMVTLQADDLVALLVSVPPHEQETVLAFVATLGLGRAELRLALARAAKEDATASRLLELVHHTLSPRGVWTAPPPGTYELCQDLLDVLLPWILSTPSAEPLLREIQAEVEQGELLHSSLSGLAAPLGAFAAVQRDQHAGAPTTSLEAAVTGAGLRKTGGKVPRQTEMGVYEVQRLTW